MPLLSTCMDAVLQPRVLKRDMVFGDVREVFELFMNMVQMAVAVDVPVEKALGTKQSTIHYAVKCALPNLLCLFSYMFLHLQTLQHHLRHVH